MATAAGILRRTKSKWFARGRARDPKSVASVVAFTAWRLGLESIKRLRQAQFEIEADARYFDYLAEYLIFLAQIADRLAQPRYSLAERTEFVTFIVRRLAGNLAENRTRLLGGDLAALQRAFIDRYNARADDYAAYRFGDDGPEPAFVRHCAHALFDVFEPADRLWLIDQLMSYETPAALRTLRGVYDNLLATAAADGETEQPAPPASKPGPPCPE
jgi:hypothetical protein